MYFSYHILQGERGMFALIRTRKKTEEMEKTVAALEEEKESLSHNIYLLRPDSLDLDLLEERARIVLNYSDPGDIIISE